jgi:phage terminase large subunit-like protein
MSTVGQTLTEQWIRNESDQLAADAGCWFDLRAACYPVWWIETYCKLYEGEYAGANFYLVGCHECGNYDLPLSHEFDFDEQPEIAFERAERFAECVSAGHSIDWQYEVTMRMFGWQRHSKRFERAVRRFRQASIFVAKKNKKSPTLASWGLYLTCGDNEPGNKVFFGAKDGNQARDIAGEHAVQMVNQSEELQDECKINLNKMRITHLPSKSFLQPMSSANAQTQKGKEGINGCILIDETHVVDRDFIRRVKRAGISRPEPIHAEFSTAGDDPDSYGKERFDYAQRVMSGADRNDQLLVAIYAAPQDLTETELDLDPIKYGKLANPAWGHTIDEDEYLADYNSSKSSRRELLDFMMYRLNIWQNSSSPWLKIDDWMKGKRDFSLSDFHGKACHSALDLASVRDFASLCLAFDQGNEEIAMFWWYWLPEETAHSIRHLIDIDKWKSDSRVNLMLTPGARIDYGYIQSTFISLAEKFSIRTLAYDDWNAEQTTQEIEEGKRDREGNLILKGTGIPRINFSQSLKTMNSPTKQFEARVIDGKILHNGDPLTAWMAQNATVKPDANGNYKPMKPSKDSIKKCDGVIVGVMAAAMIDPEESVYKKRGAISIGDDEGGDHQDYEEEDAYSHWS